MALSRRLRFEILRRDNHQCRYCGGAAPDVKLTVDHVVPTALGGSDEPTNLVTACKDCNSGKASTSLDAPLVADIKADALRWARAVEIAIEIRMSDRGARDAYVSTFDAAWSEWTYSEKAYIPEAAQDERDRWAEVAGDELASKSYLLAIDDDGRAVVTTRGVAKWEKHIERREAELAAAFNALPGPRISAIWASRWAQRPTKVIRRPMPRPASWRSSIWTFYGEGIPIEELLDAIVITRGKDYVSQSGAWRYFCGVCWRQVERTREAAREIAETLDSDAGEG
ncbi:HNH endonuclease [Jiangella asiatica]|uniref:HNH endonuclease n=1 Tax=Jiangella asiatica TaxID=2530372 RepID=A0A4R5CUW9_9ACTN|nr:HNH endonuclease [Jiangella asiatica]TDE03447.1 HNH endonuclease [Jiangella asiatica]